MSLSSAGMRSICCTLPSKYLRSCAITSSHRPRPLRSLTRYSLTTVNSPDRFDLTYRFWYVGSIDCDTPVMLAMVAVGAIAMVLLRSEERRVGKECARRCSCGWSADHEKKNKTETK